MFYGCTWNFCLRTRAPGTSLTILERGAQLSWSCKIWIIPELCNYDYFNLSLNTHTCSQNSNEKKKWKSTPWQSNAKSRSRHARITCKFSTWKQAFVDALSHDADALDVNINCRQEKTESVACSFCAVWLKFSSGASTLIKKDHGRTAICFLLCETFAPQRPEAFVLLCARRLFWREKLTARRKLNHLHYRQAPATS